MREQPGRAGPGARLGPRLTPCAGASAHDCCRCAALLHEHRGGRRTGTSLDVVSSTVLPGGEPLVGEYVSLQLLVHEDLAELVPLLADPAIYSHGYEMHRRPVDADDALLVAQSFLAQQGTADVRGGGRTAYSVRLATTGSLGGAGTLVGTFRFGKPICTTRGSTSNRRCTAGRGGARR